jgi:hypothetical protein
MFILTKIKMYQLIILSIIISTISVIILRGYDKFYKKQYERSVYINQFFLVLISSIIVLYIDNHINNNEHNILPILNLQNGGSGIHNETSNFQKVHNSLKPKSLIDSNLEKIKMNFNTGIPNF